MGAWGIEMRQSDEGLDIMSNGFKPDKNGVVDIDNELKSYMIRLIEKNGFNKGLVLEEYRNFMLTASEIIYELNQGNLMPIARSVLKEYYLQIKCIVVSNDIFDELKKLTKKHSKNDDFRWFKEEARQEYREYMKKQYDMLVKIEDMLQVGNQKVVFRGTVNDVLTNWGTAYRYDVKQTNDNDLNRLRAFLRNILTEDIDKYNSPIRKLVAEAVTDKDGQTLYRVDKIYLDGTKRNIYKCSDVDKIVDVTIKKLACDDVPFLRHKANQYFGIWKEYYHLAIYKQQMQ